MDALREIAKLPFLPLDPRAQGLTMDSFQNLSPYVQACVPDLLRVAFSCLDNVTDTDGSLRALRTKVYKGAVLCFFPDHTFFPKLLILSSHESLTSSYCLKTCLAISTFSIILSDSHVMDMGDLEKWDWYMIGLQNSLLPQ